MNIEQNNKLLASWAKKKEKTRWREKIVGLPTRVLNSRPSHFPIQYTNALSYM